MGFKAKDISGQRFGKLTAIEPIGKNSRRATIWRCVCECGNEVDLPINALTTGNTSSCGCLRNGHFKGGIGAGSSQCEDLAGKRFGKLVAIKIVGKAKDRHALWECQCDCGNTTVIKSRGLKRGDNTSCGCQYKPYDHKYERLHVVYHGIKARCYQKNHRSYEWYGARGVGMCDEWLDSFQAFCDWSMANGYQLEAKRGEYTIDRIDPDKDYSPSNCRWISIQEQQQNKR